MKMIRVLEYQGERDAILRTLKECAVDGAVEFSQMLRITEREMVFIADDQKADVTISWDREPSDG